MTLESDLNELGCDDIPEAKECPCSCCGGESKYYLTLTLREDVSQNTTESLCESCYQELVTKIPHLKGMNDFEHG